MKVELKWMTLLGHRNYTHEMLNHWLEDILVQHPWQWSHDPLLPVYVGGHASPVQTSSLAVVMLALRL